MNKNVIKELRRFVEVLDRSVSELEKALKQDSEPVSFLYRDLVPGDYFRLKQEGTLLVKTEGGFEVANKTGVHPAIAVWPQDPVLFYRQKP